MLGLKVLSLNKLHYIFNNNRHSFCFFTVHVVQHGKGFHCYVAFLSSNSSVRSLLFTASGELLAAGYQNGQVHSSYFCNINHVLIP
jgi:hypothetical protein